MSDSFHEHFRVCPWWMAYTFDNPLRKLFHNAEKMFGAYLRNGMTAADIGCGMGFFSIAMAKMVGDTGRVYSIDLQQKMLDTLALRAEKAGVRHIIRLHECAPDGLNFHEKADFALTFWMAHEVPNPSELFGQICSLLKPGGIFFLAEPKMHVSESQFEEISALVVESGFEKIQEPKVSMSRSVVYEKKAGNI